MAAIKHTPGPWYVVPTPESSNQDFIVKAGHFCVASVDYDDCSEGTAHLIAASPDMLDALQMAKHIVAAEGTEAQKQQVFAAIEKATGESA